MKWQSKRSFKIDETYIESVIIENRIRKFAVNVVAKDSYELALGKTLVYKAYTWDEEKLDSNGRTSDTYLIYLTRNGKKIAFNSYTTAMSRDERLFEQLSLAENHIELKKKSIQKDKELKENLVNSISIGDIFVSSWGYDQTNIDAYQVVEKKSKTIILSEIRISQVPGTEGYMSCQVVPVKDAFVDKNVTIKKLVNTNGIKFSSYKYANKWDGKSSYYNSWYA